MALVNQNTFARFSDLKMVRECLRELRRGQLFRPRMKIVVSSTKKGHEELPLSFTHARGGLFRGIALGAGVGLAAGIVISVVEAAGRGVDPIFIAMFCLFGLMLGGFAGALTGAGNLDPKLEAIEKDGDVVVAVETTDARDIDWAAGVFTKWGSHPQYRGAATVSDHRAHPSGA